MKKVFIAINLVMLMSALAAGQNSKFKKDPNDLPEPNKRGSEKRDRKVDGDKSAAAPVLLESGTVLDASLMSTLSTKKAQIGDEVVLKVTKSLKHDGETIVPKGTRLIGRVTDVKRKSKEDKSSRLGIVFDTLQNNDLSAPISASVVSVASAATGVQAPELFGANASGTSRTSAGSSSGGLLGGATGAAGSVLGTASSTVGGVTDTVGGTVNGATPVIGRSLKGVQLIQPVSGSAEGSSTLSAENRNIKLSKGTQFRIQLNEPLQQ